MLQGTEGLEGFPCPAAEKRGRGGGTGSTDHASPISRVMCHQPRKSTISGVRGGC